MQKKFFPKLDSTNSNHGNFFNINSSLDNINNTDLKNLISKLKFYSNQTKQTNIIFSDYYISNSCYDKNAFILFEYYLNNSIDIPYYIINNESDFYISLLKRNKTKNLILFNKANKPDFYKQLFLYLKDTKIIISSYSIRLLQIIPSYVPYIKYLKINHGIKHFKIHIAKEEFIDSLGDKINVICSSKYEYELLTKVLKYKKEYIHNASLVRYERFQFIKKNINEKKCILVAFTYRSYNKYIFQKSNYKINLEKFLNDKELIFLLTKNNIDLIYIPHHEEIDLGKIYPQNNYKYAKIKNQSNLEYYIEQCSLLITDFSSISFDFMFQNKPVLFYAIDKDDNNSFIEKKYMDNPNDILYFGNYFSEKNLLIKKIKYYVDNNFTIKNELKQNYESIFFMKKNIIPKIIKIINNIENKKNI